MVDGLGHDGLMNWDAAQRGNAHCYRVETGPNRDGDV